MYKNNGADPEAETTKEHQHGQQHQIILLKIIKNSDAKQWEYHASLAEY